jgi:RNA polymerase sigma-B factor
VLLAELAVIDKDDPRRDAVRARLVALHLPLVTYLARRFANRAEPLDDLIQVGSIGLIKAIDRFDPERGLEFSTFATPTILGEIKRHFRDTGWLVHVPRRAQELQSSLNAARAELSQQLGRSPTVGELAQRLQLEQDVVLEALDASRAYAGVPLDVLVPSGETVPDHPALGITELGFDQVDDRSALRGAIAQLPQQEREILALRFLGNKSQSEIATLIGVSQMQVSRIVARSLKKLRETLEET